MKVYMAVDMEGATGIGSRQQTGEGSPLYQEGRRLLTRDVNAAVQGALDGGATEVLVADVHSNSYNLVHEMIHPQAKVFYGQGPRSPRFPYLTKDTGAFFLVGYHAMAGTRFGVLEHTMSSKDWAKVEVNGVAFGEAAIDGAIAGELGIPTVLATGDRALCDETRHFFPSIETAVVKEGTGRHGALCLSVAATEKLIREAAARAVAGAAKAKPFVVPGPVRVRLTYKHTENADGVYGERPGEWKRIDGHTIERQFARLSDWFGGQWGDGGH